ncbi:MAG: Flp family type IVb pilin [Candidatus Wallbacteria bacterium]|nr:Flp family type IVb pilin [Candidatus Wallbacteria bacterium]
MTRFFREESGQGMVEYGLILGLIAIVAIAALTATGSSIGDIFDTIKTKLSTANTSVS